MASVIYPLRKQRCLLVEVVRQLGSLLLNVPMEMLRWMICPPHVPSQPFKGKKRLFGYHRVVTFSWEDRHGKTHTRRMETSRR